MPYGGTLDYSFKELRTLQELATEVPRHSDPLGVAAGLKKKKAGGQDGGASPREGEEVLNEVGV